ncbi:TIR domain-containing adapter molecule 1 [Scomber japonicus]|uniref:TIR domain-containing adapter molecule 1 n=1 Tax=Scomber japonicus TaxID=13676 RepID=UPI0023051CA7|nr:TIR domain-containing adapter molecule 1 [Scomber japonicus]XP_053186290.1 TIR domain-containing adapter molecule 1 [Scomber japonicus]
MKLCTSLDNKGRRCWKIAFNCLWYKPKLKMSHKGPENEGTGLRDVCDILVKAPPERLRSLTFQLRESPEDNIIHALCLIVLQQEEQALNKLQMLTDNNLANHLVETWKMSRGKLEDFAVRCSNTLEFTRESLATLARIFKVLSEQRLCDQRLRNLAYMRALSTESQKRSNGEDLEYDRLREEAKTVCGPSFAEMMLSFSNLKLGSSHDSHSSLNEGSTTLKVTLSQDQSESGLPSPLHAGSSLPSYPTHLEISTPPTATFHGDKITPQTSGSAEQSPVAPAGNEVKTSPEESKLKSNEPPLFKDTKMDTAHTMECSKTETPNQTTEPKFSLPTATPKMTETDKMHERKGAEKEEEEIFYAFVILHAQEDAEVAESLKEKLEDIVSCEGATFSEDFAIPGKSTFRCIEDAIDNSAFTLLLLTCNFTRLQEVMTDSALINSINHKHKYNTVIPLLPMENRMPNRSMPIVLQRLVPLDEKKNFDKKARKILSPANINKQKRIWEEEQRVKLEIETQEKLKHLNQHQKQLIQECKRTQLLGQETLNHITLTHNRHFPCQQQPIINITNSQYVMIGDDSQMTVGHGGGDSIQGDEEQ